MSCIIIIIAIIIMSWTIDSLMALPRHAIPGELWWGLKENNIIKIAPVDIEKQFTATMYRFTEKRLIELQGLERAINESYDDDNCYFVAPWQKWRKNCSVIQALNLRRHVLDCRAVIQIRPCCLSAEQESKRRRTAYKIQLDYSKLQMIKSRRGFSTILIARIKRWGNHLGEAHISRWTAEASRLPSSAPPLLALAGLRFICNAVATTRRYRKVNVARCPFCNTREGGSIYHFPSCESLARACARVLPDLQPAICTEHPIVHFLGLSDFDTGTRFAARMLVLDAINTVHTAARKSLGRMNNYEHLATFMSARIAGVARSYSFVKQIIIELHAGPVSKRWSERLEGYLGGDVNPESSESDTSDFSSSSSSSLDNDNSSTSLIYNSN